jgi:hypothetical protein
VYHFFCVGNEDGIHGDFQQFVALNDASPVSSNWFMRVWNASFSNLYTESDKPQCPECFDLKGLYLLKIISCKGFNSY